METNRYDAYREDRAGRANVADSPERVAYYQELARLETGALWTVANKIEPWAPRSASVPVVWRYRTCAATCCARPSWSRPRKPAAA